MFIIVYHCLSLFIIVYHCLSLFIIVYHCLSLFIIVYHCLSLFIIVYHCLSLFIIVYHCLSLFIIVYHCLSLFIIVYHCLSLFIIVYPPETMVILVLTHPATPEGPRKVSSSELVAGQLSWLHGIRKCARGDRWLYSNQSKIAGKLLASVGNDMFFFGIYKNHQEAMPMTSFQNCITLW